MAQYPELAYRHNIPIEDTLVFEDQYTGELKLSLRGKRNLKQQGAEFIYLVEKQTGELIGETYYIEVDKLKERIKGLSKWKNRNAIYVYSNTVLPKYQGNGLGTILKAFFLGQVNRTFSYALGHAKDGASWNLNKRFGAILIKEEKDWAGTNETYNFYKIELANGG